MYMCVRMTHKKLFARALGCQWMDGRGWAPITDWHSESVASERRTTVPSCSEVKDLITETNMDHISR